MPMCGSARVHGKKATRGSNAPSLQQRMKRRSNIFQGSHGSDTESEKENTYEHR
jgi:hypothetical protein